MMGDDDDERIPFVTFGNDELGAAKRLTAGEMMPCYRCGGEHEILDSVPAGAILSVRCGDNSYLVGVNGRDVSESFRRRGAKT